SSLPSKRSSNFNDFPEALISSNSTTALRVKVLPIAFPWLCPRLRFKDQPAILAVPQMTKKLAKKKKILRRRKLLVLISPPLHQTLGYFRRTVRRIDVSRAGVFSE